MEQMKTNTTTTTRITEENYCLAETQIIFKDYSEKINKVNTALLKKEKKNDGSESEIIVEDIGGVGILMHQREAMDPKEKTIMRPNFDTLYSFVILDFMPHNNNNNNNDNNNDDKNLYNNVDIIMPNTNGRYQTAWIITEEHYNPMALTKEGTFRLTYENMGTRFITIIFRTQVNMLDAMDLSIAHKCQDGIQIIQSQMIPRGTMYLPSYQWDMDEMLIWRKKYQNLVDEKGYIAENLFGAKEDENLTDELHNCGCAYGWGGFTKEQAKYIILNQNNVKYNQDTKLILSNVPIAENAFWSLTIYDQDGYSQDCAYNINSAFAIPNSNDDNKIYTIYFGEKKENIIKKLKNGEKEINFLKTFPNWNCVVRLYLPKDEALNGEWQLPSLELV